MINPLRIYLSLEPVFLFEFSKSATLILFIVGGAKSAAERAESEMH